MNDVEFERLLSFRPKLQHQLSFEQPCLRDMIFDYYCGKYQNQSEKANEVKQAYTDELFKLFVNRKM